MEWIILYTLHVLLQSRLLRVRENTPKLYQVTRGPANHTIMQHAGPRSLEQPPSLPPRGWAAARSLSTTRMRGGCVREQGPPQSACPTTYLTIHYPVIRTHVRRTPPPPKNNVTGLGYPDGLHSIDECVPYDYDWGKLPLDPVPPCAAVEVEDPTPTARFYMKLPKAAVDMDGAPAGGRGAVWWFDTALTYYVDGLCEPAKYPGWPCTFGERQRCMQQRRVGVLAQCMR